MPASLTLPDGRRLGLDATTAGRVRAGVVVLGGVVVREEPAVWAEIDTLAAAYREEFAGCLPSEIAPLGEARRLYKSFGMDPSRHRPSSEALLRRVLNHKGLYRLNNAVDTCNLASLAFLLPIGMYDLDRIVGDVVIRRGRPGEEYEGIRKGPVHLADRLGLFDTDGGFGSPTSDSARTAVGDTTTRILAVIMATGAYPATRLESHADRFASLFVRHCRATGELTALLGD
ncbi:MAG: phenylalanine--tRNA ligase beta subunit-related protein [Candidatus Krumholzibacteriia bacterium]